MSTVEVDRSQEQSIDVSENLEIPELKISGFDAGKKSILKEPSLYLSLITIFIATSVCFGKTPLVFWISFVAISALAVAFHVIAERLLFRANKEYDAFAAPFEGVFVLTLGVILPGLGLLAYGIFSAVTAVQTNVSELTGKLLLLLVVPLFNFAVWSAVRKRYLTRPRLIGLMNGLALGLSASWTIIWLTSMLFNQGAPSCKLGWMLLLCMSPALLFAAACLNFELWRKTEAHISRITTTFSVLGGVLSLLFVFTPMGRSLYVQSLVTDAKFSTSTAQQSAAVATLRTVATEEDLRPSLNPISGFALAQMLVPNRGLDSGTDVDQNMYFRITGQPFKLAGAGSETEYNENIGVKIPGLALSKSQIVGNIDASTLSGSLDWTFTFHNSSGSPQEARAEIKIPHGATVSRATLWVEGKPREAAFASTMRTTAAYEAIVNERRDPLLVKMLAPDRVLVRCFPVPTEGRPMKIRLGFKLPLECSDGKTCTMQTPTVAGSNFSQPKRHRISLASRDKFETMSGLDVTKSGGVYSINGILKMDEKTKGAELIVVQKPVGNGTFGVEDSISKKFIVSQLRQVSTGGVKHLAVVVDQSSSLGDKAEIIKSLLTSLPSRLKPTVYFAREQNPDDKAGTQIVSQPLTEAIASLDAGSFVGGQDNLPLVREALEVAAERPDSAVIWIHGPQSFVRNAYEKSAMDVVHHVRLFDLQLSDGPNTNLQTLQRDDVSDLVSVESVTAKNTEEINSFVSLLDKGSKKLVMKRTATPNRPENLVSDPSVTAQVVALWAQGEVDRLMAEDEEGEAIALGTKYRIASTATGAIVFENDKQHQDFVKARDAFAATPLPSRGPGLVGAPVDPRYGQSNEVGQLADFGYDTARDISRFVTLLAGLISTVIAGLYLRKNSTQQRLIKAGSLVVIAPLVVHLLGTFMINNYGGLGGGL